MIDYNSTFLRCLPLRHRFNTTFLSIVLFFTICTNSYALEFNLADYESSSKSFLEKDFSLPENYNNLAEVRLLENASPLIVTAELVDTEAVDKNNIETTTDKSTVALTSASNVADTEQRTPDWNGVIRDISIIFGGQVAAVAITYVMPESFSAWTPEQKKAGWAKYKANFVNPVLDKDQFYVNYTLHPYWGATYYTRARERGLDQTYSFLYSVLLSTMYEFGTECIAEKPSIQDLIVTPVAGSLLGAYIFEPWRESIKRKSELRWYDHTALVLTDPLGVISLGVEKMFGIKSTIMVNLPVPQIQNGSLSTTKNYLGATMQFAFN